MQLHILERLDIFLCALPPAQLRPEEVLKRLGRALSSLPHEVLPLRMFLVNNVEKRPKMPLYSVPL
jgi:hypothetical protein